MAHDITVVGLAEGDATQRIFAEFASHDYLETFGVETFRGRFFTQSEEAPESGSRIAARHLPAGATGGECRPDHGATATVRNDGSPTAGGHRRVPQAA